MGYYNIKENAINIIHKKDGTDEGVITKTPCSIRKEYLIDNYINEVDNKRYYTFETIDQMSDIEAITIDGDFVFYSDEPMFEQSN